MKKLLFVIAGGLLLAVGCNKSSSNADKELQAADDSPTAVQRNCASQDVLLAQMQQDPTLEDRMNAIERFTQNFIQNPDQQRLLPSGIIEIPVVVNVLYRTSAQNISLAQIQSQIDVLNEDYAGTNADHNLTST